MVELIDETQRYPHPEGLRNALERLMLELKLTGRELTLVLVDDARIHELNLLDREVDAPTDVLSYPLNEPDDVGVPEVPHLGDIIISLDTAARQAAAAGHSLEEETKVLAAHGLMHLLGYDHQTEAAWQDFKNAQTLILTLS